MTNTMTHRPLTLPRTLERVCQAITVHGGRALVVGGYVRDHLLGLSPKDVDIEVFDLPGTELEDVLSTFGEVITVGRAFGVYKVKGIDADFSLPRRDNKVALGHRGFEVAVDVGLDFDEAARRRDFTINSIGLDPLTGVILDPHGGEADLRACRLRATDEQHFAEDPLRGLRAAQFIARFEFEPDNALVDLCAELDLNELPGERIGEEFRKLLLKGRKPSLGLTFLQRTGLLAHFPQLAALRGVPQDAKWHPEGDVWVHTLMVVDEAAQLRHGDGDAALMFAALCHDFGKPETTFQDAQGRIRSPAHDQKGIAPTQTFMGALKQGQPLIHCVSALVATHLSPALLVQQDASPKAYRRLARKLDAAGASIPLLVDVARADHLGRTTDDALARVVPWREPFAERASAALTDLRAPTPAVSGRHLIERGLRPGVEFGHILAACQDVQDETGWTDATTILNAALENEAGAQR
jgi:tRNA nucleotidyltransferase (CCA-adding enzyme)